MCGGVAEAHPGQGMVPDLLAVFTSFVVHVTRGISGTVVHLSQHVHVQDSIVGGSWRKDDKKKTTFP